METVIIVPGLMGSELTNEITDQKVWINPAELAFGRFRRLMMNLDGSDTYGHVIEVKASGLVKALYEKLIGSFTQYSVYEFAYDWRQNIDVAAGALKILIETFNSIKYHIITHSLGGVIGRRVIQLLAMDKGEQWVLNKVASMTLIAPANHGCFVAAYGIAAQTKQVPVLKLFPEPGKFAQETTRSWTSLYQVLPWEENIFPSLSINNVGSIGWWNGLADETRLSQEFGYQSRINTYFFDHQTHVIIGSSTANPTPSGVQWKNGEMVPYGNFIDGDGFVPHISSILPNVETWLSTGSGHLELPHDKNVIQACQNIIQGRKVTTLLPY